MRVIGIVGSMAAWVALAALGLMVIVLIAGKIVAEGFSHELLTKAIIAPLTLATIVVGLWVKLSGSMLKWKWGRGRVASAFAAVAFFTAFATLTNPEANDKYYGIVKLVLDDGVDYNLILIKTIGANSCMQQSRKVLEGATRRFREEGCAVCQASVVGCHPLRKLSTEIKNMVGLRPMEVSYVNKDDMWIAYYWKSIESGYEACEANASQFSGVCVKGYLAPDAR